MKKQWTTVVDFVAYGKTNPKVDSIEVLGFDSENDGGALFNR